MKKKRRKIVKFVVSTSTPTATSAKCLPTKKPSWSLGRTTFSPSVGRLSSAPDVPTGSDCGLILEGVTEEDEKPGILALDFFKKGKAGGGPSDTKYIRFLHHLTDNLLVKWESSLLGSKLYVQLPGATLHQGSRDSLVELLDVAEEQLGCTEVIVMFGRNRQDFASLIRTFKFMGFETLPPDHEWAPPCTDHFYMAYKV